MAAMLIGTVSYLWFFTTALRPGGELLRESVSPSGEWAYRLYSIDYKGAAGSPIYEVRVSPVNEPDAQRLLYSDYGRPVLEWAGSTTLLVDEQSMDVRVASVTDLHGPIERALTLAFKVVAVVVPAAVIAGVGAALLIHSRRRASQAQGRRRG